MNCAKNQAKEYFSFNHHLFSEGQLKEKY